MRVDGGGVGSAMGRVLTWAAAVAAVAAELLAADCAASAVEAVVDRVSPERHDLSKRAKDLGSAAVLIALATAAAVWALVLWP